MSIGGRSERLASEELSWAWESVEALISERSVDSVALLCALADAVEDDDAALAYLGAGPVETLLTSGPLGSGVIAALDDAVVRSSRLQIALRCVWWSGDDDPQLVQRFSRFGPPA